MKTIIESGYKDDVLNLSNLSYMQQKKLLKVAASNRVLFILCKKIAQYRYLGMKGRILYLIDKILTDGETIINQYSIILKTIKKKFEENNISFQIVKTDRKFDYILSDVDILIENNKFIKAQELLSQMPLAKNIHIKKQRWHYKFKSKVHIDIHKMGTDWYSENFIDTDSIWKNLEQRQFLGDIYPFPSQQNEWIFNVLNIIHEKFCLTYLDLLFFEKAINVNYAEINKIAKKHGWDIGLRILSKYLKNFGCLNRSVSNNQKIEVPLMFSSIDFLKIFIARLFRFRKETRLSLYYFLYFFYCKLRFLLSRKYRISYIGNWFEI